MKESNIPYWIKSFSEIHQTTIDLSVVTMKAFIYQSSECKNMVCHAVIL